MISQYEPSKKQVNRVKSRALAARQRARGLQARGHALRYGLARPAGAIDSVYRICIHRYREINLRVRSTPAPLYFANRPAPLWDSVR